MSHRPEEPRPRASVLGKGWEILRGTQPPQEDVLGAGSEDPLLESADLSGGTTPAQATPVRLAGPEYAKLHASPRPDVAAAPGSEEAGVSGEADTGAARSASAIVFEAGPAVEVSGVLRPVRSIYVSRPEVAVLVPRTPEVLSDAFGEAELDASASAQLPTQPPAEGVSSRGEVLARFVTDDRLESLLQELHATQDALASTTLTDADAIDAFQFDLKRASGLALKDLASYEEARAILTHVRAGLAVQERMQADIARYKPQILIYLLLIFGLWLVLMALEPLFRQFMTETIGLEILAFVYHPALFGMLGGLVNAYFNLNPRLMAARGFQASQVSWYLQSPVLGLVLGLLTTLLFGVAIVSTVSGGVLEATPAPMLGQYPFLLWVVCFLAGYGHELILGFLSRFSRRPAESPELAEKPVVDRDADSSE